MPPPTVSSAPAAASENRRSRRAGTSKAWMTWTQVNSPASGTSIELSWPAWAAPTICSTKEAKTPSTATASSSFTHCQGLLCVT